MKKRIFSILCIVLAAVMCFVFTACNDNNDQTVIKVVVPDGAPALAVAKLLNSSEFVGYDVQYEIVAGATDITAKISSGQADIAIMPTNLAAKMYSSGVDIKIVAANVFGLLYLVGTEPISSVSSLRGEKILCTGQGGTPDFVLRHVLSQYGISTDDVDIQYIAQGSDAIAALKEGVAKFALLGEPAASMAVAKAGASILVNLQDEWEKTTGDDGYPQACTVVTGNMFNNYSAFLKSFLAEVRANTEWVVNNVDAVNAALKNHGSVSNFSASEVIQRCNIRYVGAMEAKNSIVKYLEIMQAFNVQFVGSELPSAGIYAGVNLD